MSTKIYSIKTKYDNDEEIKINAYNLGEVKETADSGNADTGSSDNKTIDDLIDSASLQEPYKYYSTNTSNENTTTDKTESGEGIYYNNTTTSKPKGYFWVEDLKNWCRYAIINNYIDYKTPNIEKLAYGISFKLQVWNGSNGWIDIDENGNVYERNDPNKIANFQKDIIERLILPNKNENKCLDEWDIKSINKITQARGNVNYINFYDLDTVLNPHRTVTFRKVKIEGGISTDLERLFNNYNLLVDQNGSIVSGTTAIMDPAFEAIESTNNIKIIIYVYIKKNTPISDNKIEQINNLFAPYDVTFAFTGSGKFYSITGKYTDVFEAIKLEDYISIINEYYPIYCYENYETRLLDTYYVKALNIPKNKQIIKGFKLQKTINYCINTNADFQTYRYILSQDKSDFVSMRNYKDSEHRTVSYTGIPPIWRLPTGEVFLSTNFECNTDVGMPYKREQLSFNKTNDKVREPLSHLAMLGTDSVGAENSVEVTSFISSIYADDITKFEAEINSKISDYFGTGKDKTIKKDWLREYSITKVINTETDYVNMLDSNLIFEQVNSNNNAQLKCTLKVNRPNVITDEHESVDYVKKW